MKTVDTGRKNEDGSPHFQHIYEGPEGGGLLHTGPVAGSVLLKDGTAYDVTPDVIEHAPGHAGPLLHHIEKIHEATGALGEFTHTCSEACGPESSG